MTAFRRATPADDALVRRLLRDNGMPTWVEMTVRREPSFFAAGRPLGEEWAVIGEDGADVVGMYTASLVAVFVDGRPERLGYLGGLRVNREHRHRIRHLRDGYASIGALAPAAGTLPWWFTVVAADNVAARRLLEAGVAGLPGYHALGEYVTFGIATARGRNHGLWRRCDEADTARVIAFHNRHASAYDLAPVLDEQVLAAVGLANFRMYEDQGEVGGVAALWDQRRFKQIVANHYRRPIAALLPAYNAYAKVFRRVPLPRAGRALEQTFVAFLALADGTAARGRELLEDLLAQCATPAASLGLSAAHPLAQTVAELKPLRYPARIYAVTFDAARPVSARPAQPEVALL
jgi:hypothetical protein